LSLYCSFVSNITFLLVKFKCAQWHQICLPHIIPNRVSYSTLAHHVAVTFESSDIWKL
jgi:hypothetical protein